MLGVQILVWRYVHGNGTVQYIAMQPRLVECWFKRLDKEHLTLIKQ